MRRAGDARDARVQGNSPSLDQWHARARQGDAIYHRTPACICFQSRHNHFYCLLRAKLFPSPGTESYFFNTAKIDFLIRNRTTNIIASRSVRLINLGLAERCIYWFRCLTVAMFIIAGSTLGCLL